MSAARARRPGAVPGIAAAALLVAGVTILARVVGFGRVLVFAHTVGPSCLGDTYFTANTIPNILFDVVAGGALSSLVVPVLAGPVQAGDDETADRTASALLTWTVLLLVPVMIAGLFLARPLMELLVGNGNPGCSAAGEQAAGARMLLVFMPQVVLYGAGVVLVGILQAHRRFLGPALAPLLSSLVVIGAYLLFAAVAERRETSLSTLTRSHELVLSVGTTLGVAALALPLLVPLRRTGRRLRPALRFPPGVAKTARRMAVAGAVVLGSQDLATGAIIRLANDRGSAGAVVLFNLAWTVFLLPWAVLAVPLATAAFPTLTARWQSGEIERYCATVARTTRAIVLATAAAAAVMVATSRPAARVVVLGAPGGVAPDVLARALITFAPGLIGYGALAHLSRAHYAQGDARTPALATASGWLLTVVADVALVAAMPRDWTAAALGIGSSVGMTVAGGWLALTLRRGAGAASTRGVARTVGASLAGASVAGALALALGRTLPQGGVLVSVGITIAVAGVCLGLYGGILTALDRSTLMLVLRRRQAGV
ncbi:MAG: putative peptidoglycan lipid flippase [Frankiaceae bacterium]|nr:putative peptidoglycan lipid flippase [Frankiaceae bacterium]